MFMMLYAGHFITDSTCHNLITNSSLFVKVPCLGQWPVHILTQILIWSYSFAVLSRIRGEKNHTHVHTQAHACTPHTHPLSPSLFCPISWLFLFLQCLTACLTILCRFLSYKWHVRPVLAVSWQPHCLLPHIWAAGSVVPSSDLPLSQRTVSSSSLVLS